jgi:hypothetical protein
MLKKYLKNQNINLKVMSDKINRKLNLVELDENRVPKNYYGLHGGVDLEEAKAIMLSVWEVKRKYAY